MRSRLTPRRFLALAGTAVTCALAASALAGCSSSSSTPSSSSSSASTGSSQPAATTAVTTLAAPNGPNSLNPTLNGNGTPLVWYTQLDYAPLIYRNQAGVAEPDLATSWHYTANRLSFIMELRKGVKFSDGEPLTATAVVNSLKYTKANSHFPYLSNVKTITATGPLQVTITLVRPDPLLPYGFDQEGQEGDIIAPAGLKDPTALGTQSFGAGEYVLDTKATIANSTYVYTANPLYWDQSQIHFKKISINVIADENSTLSALESGQVQAAQVNSNIAAAGKSAGLNLGTASAAFVGVYFSDIDGKTAPEFASAKVRQALNMALNRPAITTALYGTSAVPTDQYAAPGTPGYVASLENVYAYNPTKAKQLLAQAGYPHGFSFSLLVQPGALNQDLLAQAMAQDWQAIGVTATLTAPTGFPQYVTDLEDRKYPATTYNFYYSNFLTVMQGQFTNPALYNLFDYTDAQSNVYANQMRLYDVGTAASNAVATKYETYVIDQAFACPVASADTLMLSTKNLANVQFTAAFPIPDPANWTPAS